VAHAKNKQKIKANKANKANKQNKTNNNMSQYQIVKDKLLKRSHVEIFVLNLHHHTMQTNGG
jgi:hypothetical protein